MIAGITTSVSTFVGSLLYMGENISGVANAVGRGFANYCGTVVTGFATEAVTLTAQKNFSKTSSTNSVSTTKGDTYS